MTKSKPSSGQTPSKDMPQKGGAQPGAAGSDVKNPAGKPGKQIPPGKGS